MIEAFSLRTAHHFGDALASQAALRHRVFVEQRSLDHLSYDGLEYDAFDTPAAVYLVWRDTKHTVRGMVRLLPTTLPYMLQSCWPELVEDGRLPEDPETWEITRVCVDRSFEPRQRVRILPELLCAAQEWFEANGVTTMIGVTRKHLLNHFIRRGVTWLGPEAMVEGEMEAAFRVPVSKIRPDLHCQKFEITGSRLRVASDEQLAA